MNKPLPTSLLFILLGISASSSSWALSPQAEQGKALYAACDVCHKQANDPPAAPPMWGVKRRYLKHYGNDSDFVKNMVAFVKAPSLERAIHTPALQQLGLMPALPLPDPILNNLAQFILENEFEPPCDHWKLAIERAKTQGDAEHASKDMKMHQRFCQ